MLSEPKSSDLIFAGEQPADSVARHVRYGLVIVKMKGSKTDNPSRSSRYFEPPSTDNKNRICSINYLAGWRSLTVQISNLEGSLCNFEFWDKNKEALDIKDTNFTIQKGEGDLKEVLEFLRSTYLRLMEKSPSGAITSQGML